MVASWLLETNIAHYFIDVFLIYWTKVCGTWKSVWFNLDVSFHAIKSVLCHKDLNCEIRKAEEATKKV